MSVTLAIATGDPQGVGPAISVVAARRAVELGARAILVGDARLLERRGARSSDGVDIHDVPAPALDEAAPSAAGGVAAITALEAACDLVDAGRADALVTAPLSKEAVARTREGFVGHTGWLGRRYGVEPVMMLADEELRIVLATDHVAVADISRTLDRELLERVLTAARRAVTDLFAVTRPHIAVLGLNPHAGEGGKLGREEIDVIVPAMEACGGREAGFRGPFPADSFFRPGRSGAYDVVVAMYHDQGLIALKSSSMGLAVNISLGLPIVRTSPDHGTAFDLPEDVVPDHGSMVRAVEEALRLTMPRD